MAAGNNRAISATTSSPDSVDVFHPDNNAAPVCKA